MTAVLERLLKAERYALTESVTDGALARRRCSEQNYSIIIINAPLPDEFGDGLALELLQRTDSGVILVVDAAQEAMADSKMSLYGALVLSRPFDRKLFSKALRLTEASQCRMSGIKRENILLQQQIEEIRILNRAKYILMEYLSMTEPQAHKYLEKQAMDLRITKLEVAKNLLSTYENAL